jgi:hypothetical protein
MAAPPRVTRALAVRLLRRIEDELYPAAQAAGHPPGPTLRFADGMTRVEAAAFRQWAMAIPALRRAMVDRGGWRDEAQAVLRLTTYFEAEHPQTAAGEPEPWTEPLSPAMRTFALRDRHDLPADELLPEELETLLEYASVRNDPGDAEGPRAATVRAEVDQIIAAAERALAAAPAPSQEQGESEMQAKAPMDPQLLAAELEGLGPWQKAAYFEEKFGAPTVEKPPAPASVIAPPVMIAAPHPASAKQARAPVDPATLRAELKGLSPADRRAALDARFGSGVVERSAPTESPPPTG